MNFFQILRLLFSSLQKNDDHILCLIGYLFEQPPLCICKAFPCIFLSICCVMISSEIEILYPAGKLLSLKVNNPENHQKIPETNLFPRLLLLRVNKSNCKKDSETRRAAQKKQKPAKPGHYARRVSNLLRFLKAVPCIPGTFVCFVIRAGKGFDKEAVSESFPLLHATFHPYSCVQCNKTYLLTKLDLVVSTLWFGVGPFVETVDMCEIFSQKFCHSPCNSDRKAILNLVEYTDHSFCAFQLCHHYKCLSFWSCQLAHSSVFFHACRY